MINKIVSFTDPGMSSKFGKVVAVKDYWRPTPPGYGQLTYFDAFKPPRQIDQRLFHVHYIERGRLMACPDDRPHNDIFACPICGANCRLEEIREFSPNDLAYFIEHGYIHKDVVK